jgi:hypothetical protein
VNVPASALRQWARVGVEIHWWDRAVVTVAGAVEFVDDNGEWWAENGL